MTKAELRILIESMDRKIDSRRFPDERRKGRFRAGWAKATTSGKEYIPSTLERLTWENLGYRLGKELGERELQEVNAFFAMASQFYREAKLTEAMEGMYRQIGRAVGYWPSYFLRQVRRNGGLTSAKSLLDPAKEVSVGFERLRAGGRLDLTIEALALDERFEPLFTPEELGVARERLGEFLESGLSVQISPDENYPETLSIGPSYHEGHVTVVTVNRHERSKRARAACLRHHGFRCAVCDLDFVERYGAIGKDFIHVHHRYPVCLREERYKVDPKLDLVPVCPNCHAMLHTAIPPITVGDLKARLRD